MLNRVGGFFYFTRQVGNEVQKNQYGVEKDGEPVNRVDGYSGNEDIIARGDGFGKNFAEHKNEKCHDPGCNPHGITGEHADGNRGGQGCGPHVDDIVADQNRC